MSQYTGSFVVSSNALSQSVICHLSLFFVAQSGLSLQFSYKYYFLLIQSQRLKQLAWLALHCLRNLRKSAEICQKVSCQHAWI